MFFFRRKQKAPPTDWATQRQRMVSRDLEGRDITDPRILSAMASIPREDFMPPDKKHLAYADHAVPIGHRQTISQPYIVALTMQLAGPKATDRALEVGCGSGYAAAVLGQLVASVTTIEIIEEHATAADIRLSKLNASNIRVIQGDGSLGHEDGAPYDVIVCAAAPQEIPPALVDQLALGGRLVIPVGAWNQRMVCITRSNDGNLKQSDGIAVSFVPMTGAAWKPPSDH